MRESSRFISWAFFRTGLCAVGFLNQDVEAALAAAAQAGARTPEKIIGRPKCLMKSMTSLSPATKPPMEGEAFAEGADDQVDVLFDAEVVAGPRPPGP
jgi:hypothetical protein